jgi:hypothetical protein
MFENGCFAVVSANSRNRILQIVDLFDSENAAQEAASKFANELREKKIQGKAKGYVMVRVFNVKVNPEIVAAGKVYLTPQDLNSRHTGGACVGAYCAW